MVKQLYRVIKQRDSDTDDVVYFPGCCSKMSKVLIQSFLPCIQVLLQTLLFAAHHFHTFLPVYPISLLCNIDVRIFQNIIK